MGPPPSARPKDSPSPCPARTRPSSSETVHGSRAYGLATESSDTDLRGVFVPPWVGFAGYLQQPDQLEPSAERVLYEVRKFLRLAAACNPTVIEVLFTDFAHHVTVSPEGQRLLDRKRDFLSRLAGDSFGKYGLAQLHRIRTHRRWLLSIGPMRNRPPETSRTVTRWSPNGFGRWVRGARREHSGERDLGVAARVHFEHVAIRSMKPGDDDDLVPRGDPEQALHESRAHLEPRVRRSLQPLPRRLVQRSKRRSQVSDGAKRVLHHRGWLIREGMNCPPGLLGYQMRSASLPDQSDRPRGKGQPGRGPRHQEP